LLFQTAYQPRGCGHGGSGVWGAIPMPPNNVPDVDLKALVEWILALK
jgi:cytochrome c